MAYIACEVWLVYSKGIGGIPFKKVRAYNSPGPNYCWHVDENDKLKPFGFPIHDAVDGYSRRVLWLYVDTTNNDPKVMGRYFIDCVEEVVGCPSLVRTDCVTENVVIASVQSRVQ